MICAYFRENMLTSYAPYSELCSCHFATKYPLSVLTHATAILTASCKQTKGMGLRTIVSSACHVRE